MAHRPKDFLSRLLEETGPFRSIVEHAHDFVTIVDREQIIRYINHTVPGLSVDEVLGLPVADFVETAYHDLVSDSVERVFETGRSSTFVSHATGPMGTVSTYENRVSPVRDGSGDIVGVSIVASDITSRRRAEEELRRERDLFQRSLNVIDAIVVALDVDGRVTLINQAGADLLGVPVADVIGRRWFDEFIPSTDQNRVNAEFRELMAGRLRGAEFFENEVMTSEGHTRLVSWHNTLLKEEGVITGTLSYGQDITEASETQDALLEQQRLLASVFAAAPIGIGITEDRVLLDVNERFCDMVGRSCEDLIGQSSRVLYPSQEEFERVGTVKYAKIAQSGIGSVETQFLRSDGTLMDVFLSSTRLASEDSSGRVVFSALDITALKEARDGLAREKGFTDAVIDAAEDTLCVIRVSDSKVVRWNSVFERVSGYGDREIEAMDAPRDFFGPESQEEIDGMLQTLVSKGNAEVELDLLTKGGERLPYEYANTMLYDENGNPEYIVSVGRDVSERRHAREELLHNRDQLEGLVAARTEELETANAELVKASQAKSDFLAAMSHELRTPLNSIIGFTGIILDGMAGEVTDEQERQLVMVRKSASHLLELVNDILDLSRIEAGRHELWVEDVPVAQIVDSVVSLVRMGADKKGLRLDVDIREPKATMSTDPRGVQQILVNLVGNAIKLTQSGRVTLTVRPCEDDMTVFRVEDTGCGIPADRLPSIFAAFQQVGRPVEQNERGTGLGLAIASRLAKRLGGSIDVQSEVDVGSTFTLTVPTVCEISD